jgi:hypothetical protein
MASLATVRAAVKTTLQNNITGLWVYDKVPEVVQPPAVVVEPVQASFAVAMGRGTDSWAIDLHVLVAESDALIGQTLLDELVSGAGTRSIREVIFTNRTLGLAHTDAHVASLAGYGGEFESASFAHIGATLRLIVHTKGTE